MSPEIIAVDEIGSNDDADAILNAIYSGVKVIATVHGKDINEILKKPGVKCLIENNAFERIVFLSRKKGPGTIEEIINV
jgi:stage III sporulation protein AA